MTCPDPTCTSSISIDRNVPAYALAPPACIPGACTTLTLPILYTADPLVQGVAFSFVIKGLPAGVDVTDFNFAGGVMPPAAQNCEVIARIPTGGTAADGVWIIGYLTTATTAAIPAAAAPATLLTITIGPTAAGVWGAFTLGDEYIATNPTGQDTPLYPHPVIAEFPIDDFVYDGSGDYVSGGTSPPYIKWTGDPNGSATVTFADAQALALRVPDSYLFPFLSSGTGWSDELDADFNGLINAVDIATVLADICGNGTGRLGPALNTKLSGTAPVGFPQTNKVLASAICLTTLESPECIPCSCPDLLEDTDETICLNSAFISDYQIIDQPVGKMNSPASVSNFMPYGVVTISYFSRCSVDGYEVKLGNFKDINDVRGGQSGVLSIVPRSGEAGERRWFQSPGGDPDLDSSDIFQKDTLTRPKTHNKMVFGLSALDETYPTDVDINDPVDRERLIVYDNVLPTQVAHQPWSLPPSIGKEPRVLTKIIVNPYSFQGAPTLESFRFVTNQNLDPFILGLPVVGPGLWTGNSQIYNAAGAGFVSALDLAAIVSYVKLAGVSAASSLPALAADAVLFDADGNGDRLNIEDLWAVQNYMLSQGVGGALLPWVGPPGLSTLNIVPQDCCAATTPGSLTVTPTAYGCDVPNEGKVLVSWTVAANVSFYTIYRGIDGDFFNSSGYGGNKKTLTGLQIEQAMAQSGQTSYIPLSQKMVYEEVVVINDPAATSYVDNNPPQNVNSCAATDNPEITYIVVASNSSGETTSSGVITVPNCNSTPVAADSGVFETNINNKLSFSLEGLVTNTNSIKPWGTCSPGTRACDDLTFEVFPDLKGGTFNETVNQTGEFIFYPAKDYVGPSFIRFRVTTSNGCSDENQLRINVLPSKFDLTAIAGPVSSPQYGTIRLSWPRLSGKILRYEIYRKLGAGPYGLINTITGPYDIDIKNFVYEDTDLAIPDPCVPDPSNVYTYKVAAIGFDGLASNVPVGKQVTVESYEASATIVSPGALGIIPNNPIPVAVVGAPCPPGTPTVTLTWVAIAGAINYQIWRRTGAADFKLIALTQAVTYVDTTAPSCIDCVAGAPSNYIMDYAVVAVGSSQVPSGNPNNAAWGTGVAGDPCDAGGDTEPATITCCPPTPSTYAESFDVCVDAIFAGQVVGKVTTGETVTFAPAAPPIGAGTVALDIATGAFTYDATGVAPGTYTFQYTATACTIASALTTITLVVADCRCPGFTSEENNYVIMDLDKLESEYTLVGINQPPFSLGRRGGQTLRGTGKAYGVDEGGTVQCEYSLFDVSAISGLSLWLDPDDATTLGMGAPPLVNSIADKAALLSNGVFTAPGLVNQPTLLAYNGKNWLDFGGVDDYLIGTHDPGATSLYWSDVFGGRSFEIIIVTRPDDNSGCGGSCGNNSANPYSNTALISDDAGYGGIFVKDMDTATPTIQCYMYEAPGPGSPKTEYTQAAGDAHIYGMAQTDPGASPNRNPLTTTQDGAVTTIADVLQYNTTGMSRIIHLGHDAGALYFKGLIGEVLVFSRKLSDHERNILTSYLRNKWGTL